MQKTSSVLSWVFIIFLLLPSVTSAQSRDNQCLKRGYTIGTINGIFTSEKDASENRDALAGRLRISAYHGEPLSIEYFYNPTNGKLDYTDVAIQKLSESVDMNDPDFIRVLSDASAQVKTQKLLLVPHSQGNFYANNLYKAVTSNGDVPRESIGVYSVATPASKVEGDGRHRTSSTDTVINKARMVLPGVVLSANDNISYKSSDDEGRGHGFRVV